MGVRSRTRGSEDRSVSEEDYPWEQHELALQHLECLEISEARHWLEAMVPRLRAMPPEKVPAAGLLAFELIGRVRSTLHPAVPHNGLARVLRWKEAGAFSGAGGGPALASLFQAAVSESLQPYRATTVNPLVARARVFVEQNYARKISLRNVAEFLNLSRNYLSSLFRKECGCTITEYIHHTRLKHAEAMLVAGGHTVSEIAYQVGYQNYRDFYRNFVKYENASPTRFRRIRADRAASSATPAQA